MMRVCVDAVGKADLLIAEVGACYNPIAPNPAVAASKICY